MAKQIGILFPGCPVHELAVIAEHTAQRGSGRVGRKEAGRNLEEFALTAAVIAAEHFDVNGLLQREHYRRFAEVLEALRNADGQVVIYSDVLEYIDRENELAEGLELERKPLGKLKRGQDLTAGLLKTTLLTYQARGAIFAACRGRAVLADDMGLGKTVQALAMAELLRQRRGIERVLVIAPASVKYQ